METGTYLLNQVGARSSLRGHFIQGGSLGDKVTDVCDVNPHFEVAWKCRRRLISVVWKARPSLLGTPPETVGLSEATGLEGRVTVSGLAGNSTCSR